MAEWMLGKIEKTENSGYVFSDVIQEEIWDKLCRIPYRQRECWVGMQATDQEGVRRYVWGHRTELPQNGRQVMCFSYVSFPLSLLQQAPWCDDLTEMVFDFEQHSEVDEEPKGVEPPSKSRPSRPNRELLLNEVMAKSYLNLPGEEIIRDRFSISGSYEDLLCDIDYIWKHTLFPERLPTIVLWLGGKEKIEINENNKHLWHFIEAPKKDYSFAKLQMSLEDELQRYLYHTSYSLLKQNVLDFQEFLFQDETVTVRKQFESELPDDLPDEEKEGRNRERVFSFLLWWYARQKNEIKNETRFLPDSIQKEAMLKEFWPEPKKD